MFGTITLVHIKTYIMFLSILSLGINQSCFLIIKDYNSTILRSIEQRAIIKEKKLEIIKDKPCLLLSIFESLNLSK